MNEPRTLLDDSAEHEKALRTALKHVSTSTAGQVAFVAALCLLLSFAAQRSLDQRAGTATGILLYTVAAVAFALIMRHIALEKQQPGEEVARERIPSPLVVVLSLGLAVLGCLDFGDNRFRPLGLILWLGGLSAAMLYLSSLAPEGSLIGRARVWWKRRGGYIPIYWLGLLAILLIGAWFRLYRLHEIPADLGPDLIYHYYDTLDILEGQYRIHFPERESLLFYCTALVARFIGLSPFTLFFTSALIGTGTIVALYALGELTFGPQVGLLAALLLAISRWHVALSRSAYPAVFTPLAAILVLYTLIRALRRQRFVDFAWCGVQLGAGFYTYTPFKAMPAFILISLLLYGLARTGGESEERARGSALRKVLDYYRALGPRVLLLFVVAIAVVAPLARFAIEHPQEYFVRELVALRLQREQAELSPGLPTYYWRTLLGLNYHGDSVPRWNYPEARHMGFVSGALMVLGLAYALWRWRHGYNVLLVGAWFILLLPAALGMLPRDSASSLRMSGMMGPAVLLAALPLAAIYRALQRAWSTQDAGRLGTLAAGQPSNLRGRALILTIDSPTRHFAWTWQWQRMNVWPVVILLLSIALVTFEAREAHRFYFRDFVSAAPDRMNYSNAREIAREIQHYGDLNSVYIKVWPFWFDGMALRANLSLTDRDWGPWLSELDPQEPPLSTIEGTVLFIVHRDDHQALATLRAFFPRGVVITRSYPDGMPAFYAFYGER